MTEETSGLKRPCELSPLAEKVRTLLEQLEQLEKSTRPSGGEQTAAGKDRAAFQALQTAGELVKQVAGWAIDHQIGLATKGLGYVPAGPPGAREHPDYIAARLAANSHDHERVGASVKRVGDSVKTLDPVTERAALLNLLIANPGGFPAVVQRPAREALEALEFEEVLPILAPVKGNRKVKLGELRLQLQVIGFVEFQIATGVKKLEAVKTAARTLCVAESTIKGWEYRLRKELGPLKVARTIARYSGWGRTYTASKERWAAGDIEAKHETYEALGGLPALHKVAGKYRTLEK
jgi:hypothetical protein